MKKSIAISEQDNIAALLENDRVVEFFVNRGDLLLGDIYTCTVENILPGIDAAFVNLGKDKMGFLHANDVPGQGPLKERLVPKQKLLVQITKEPTGHKGPRVSTAISLPGRFLVLVPEERGISVSRRISESKERARLKAIVNLLKPPGVGLIIRTEAKGQGEPELFEDFEQLWDRWQSIVSDAEASIGPMLIYRDQDLLYRVIRDAYSSDINEIVVDTPDGHARALQYLSGWTGRNTQVLLHTGDEPLLIARGIDKEIEAALSDRVELPSGGHLNIQPTEALTVIDVNSGRFTSSRTQAETVRRTNMEAAQEIPRQLRLRNVGGMVIVDFIDMESRKDQQQVLEAFQRCLEEDRAKPQVGQLSDLGLVELTRRRQGQSLRELFTAHCPTCAGLGVTPTLEIGFAEHRKVINIKPKEEDLLTKGRLPARRGAQRQATSLRAATVSSGRIQPTLVAVQAEEEALAQVPPEILEQMPDELLEEAQGFGRRSSLALEADEHGEDEEEGEEEFVRAFAAESFAPPVSPEPLDYLAREPEVPEPDQEAQPEPQEEEVAPGAEIQAAQWEMTYSPYEAEPEQIAGVFRLKAKPAGQSESGTEDSPLGSIGELAGSPDFLLGQQSPPPAPAPTESTAPDLGFALTSTASTPEAGAADEQIAPVAVAVEEPPEAESDSDIAAVRPEQAQGSWWGSPGPQQLELPLADLTAEEEEADTTVSKHFPGGLSGAYETGGGGGIEIEPEGEEED